MILGTKAMFGTRFGSPRVLLAFKTPYRTVRLKDSQYFKKSYKIQFWVQKKKDPGFRQISAARIQEKQLQNLKLFLSID